MKKIILSFALLLVASGLLVYFVFPGVLYQWSISTERGRAGFEVESVQSGAVEWTYLAGGDGEALVLVHGFGADKDNWDRVGPYLTPHVRVYAPDLPGFGDTARVEQGTYTILEQSQRLIAWADAVGLDRFYLGGNSMGGQIAAQVAALVPDRVIGLWLLAPAGVVGSELSDLARMVLEEDRNPLIAQSREDFEFTLDFVFYQKPLIPGPVVSFLADRKIDREPFERAVFADLRFNSDPLESYASQLSMPVLLVWGDQDRVLHHSGADVLAGLIPELQVQRLKDVGHLPMIESPKVVAERFLEWTGKQSSESE